MVIFYNGEMPVVEIEWHIYKGIESQTEDFSRAQLWLWLVSDRDKKLLSAATAEDGVIRASFDSGMAELCLHEGTYGLKAVWVKNRERCELMGDLGGQLKMAEMRNAFGITEHEEDATPVSGSTAVLRMKSMVASYGYDGLSAYEIAVMRKVTTALSETEYVQMRASKVDTNQIADKAITAAKIADGAITGTQLADGSVTAAQLADGSVTTDKIAKGAVTTERLQYGAVTYDRIAPEAVTTEKIADQGVKAVNIYPNAVTREKIADGGINALCIDKGAVTTEKIANRAVTTEKLGQYAVMTDCIADKAVTGYNLAPACVTAAKIADGTVTSAQLADGAITDAKIADGALKDFETETSMRLTEVLERTVYLTQAEYDALVASGDVRDDTEYNIMED